ncbi:MFS transporter [Streptomyces erythrochromogenes]|uniref:MFS transporter n=1 Tax=Streptomyces erythrochromogenes TaxID=285574 RepID=UPI00341BB3DE
MTEGASGRPDEAPATEPSRWKALLLIGLAQLMVVLDSTVVDVALPSIQRDLGISDGNRQWVVTAYALAFGGLLLLGGRIADKWGRRNTFTVGLIGFALASALVGAAGGEAMLLSARALQGAFGAVLAPAALSLLSVMFTDARERAKAFGIYGAIAAGGGALGLVLGGLLTEYLDWRWAFFVNIPFAIVAALGARIVIRREPAGSRNRARLDIPGVILSTLGLVALVYGFTRAESAGWSDPVTLVLLVAAPVLLTVFVLVQTRVPAPLLPPRVLLERNRAGAYLAAGLSVTALFGLFLFLTYYFQVVKGYSPVTTGLAFLPMIAGMIVGSARIGTRLTPRIPPRMLIGPGLLLAAVGMLLLTGLEAGSSYPALILPAQILIGLGMGSASMSATALSTHRIDPADAGVASAMVNSSRQIGAAIGTALLNTIAASATTAYEAFRAGEGAGAAAAARTLRTQALVHGFSTATWWAAGILLVGAAAAFVLINTGRPAARSATPPPQTEQAPSPKPRSEPARTRC